jgi:type II secretory pathway predicted ATPase ExeA
MDRLWASTIGTGNPNPALRSPADDFALPSRTGALAALRPALEAQAGPVLLTGEAGVGKTWLWRRLQAGMPLSWRTVVVDVPPALDSSALYPLVGYGLGLPVRGVEDGARPALADFLREAAADGIRWSLVLDEAHNGSADLLEEVRVLANRLGYPDGFSALILAGQTSLAGRLATRPLNALAARLAAHVHLRALDVDETRALLNCLVPGLDWDDPTLERYHRDAAGNPRRMLLAARRGSATSARDLRERPGVEAPGAQPRPRTPPPERPRLTPSTSTTAKDAWDPSVTGPIKPPLLLGDGMIEVGWEPDHEPGSTPAPPSEPANAPAPAPSMIEAAPRETEVASSPGSGPDVEIVEAIDDHYAALQAWNEWSRNQERGAAARSTDRPPTPARLDPADNTSVDAPGEPAPSTMPPPGVWLEGQQGFAPYSQLFTRLRHVRDANESS